MTGIFISYRRIDSRDYAGRLFDRIARHFGPSTVFMDIEAGISRGADFVSAIERAVAAVDAMVVVIGHHWSTCTDDRGARRLDSDDDWVRQEIASALRRDILVLPVLVGGAMMPRAEDLPENIRGLARKQAAEISDSRWDYDTGEIFKTLASVVELGSDAQRPRSAGLRKAVRWFSWAKVDVDGPEVFARWWQHRLHLHSARHPISACSRRFTRSDKGLAFSDLLVHPQFTTRPAPVH